nr:GFA family protein [uncultured Rhodoferax sp.]
MPQHFEGQCQCGAITYRVTGESATLFACHCTECQRQSSSAFGMALWIRDPVVEILSGQLKEWIRALPSGQKMSCQFCPDCGTRLFHRAVGQTQLMSIKPGTLRDTRQLKPVGHLWVGSKQAWLHLEDGTLQYPENPDSWDALFCAWSQQAASPQQPPA